MLFYFSERETLNLSHIPQIKNVRTYKDFRRLYNTDCVKIQRRTREGKTIYPIEVSLLVPQWTGDISRHDGFSVILNISEDILLSPIKVVIDTISSSTVTIANADGYTGDGNPYFEYTNDSGELSANETTASVT